MDKHKDREAVLENLKNSISGYSFEIGDTTYKNSLEERIQAAKSASLISKQTQKQNPKRKLTLTNNRNAVIEKDTNFQNMTVNKTINNNTLELKKKNRRPSLSKINIEKTPNNSFNASLSKGININSQTKCNTNYLLKPSCKGGSMQRRLEAIKANKLSSVMSYDNTLDSPKVINNQLKNLNYQDTIVVNNVFNQSDTNVFNHYECKVKPTIHKNPSVVEHNLNNLHHNQNTTTSKNVTSVQNRLEKAKKELCNKSKLPNQNNISETENINKSPGTCAMGLYVHNIKNKTKRLNQSNQSDKRKRIPSVAKNIISKNCDINKIVDKQLIIIKQTPIVSSSIISSKLPSQINVPTKSKDPEIVKKSKQKEFNSLPEKFSVQQRLDKIKKVQLNNDDSMEWEDIIEPDNIVNQVNDLRKTTHEYEPMEWTPNSIMHCDQINYCLVIDTNILLSDLKSLTITIDTYLPEYGFLTIVLPWQVLQELDCIKKGENVLGYRAREATRWLLEMFSKNHPRLKGQPMTQKDNINPDDAILKCAIIVKERVNCVNLVTDDKILSIKSEVNGIHVKNSTWLRNLVSVKNEKKSEIFQGSLHT